MKLIMENWRKFLQEEKGVDLNKLTPDERKLLGKILAVTNEEQLSEARPGSAASRARSRKRRRERESQKIKDKQKNIELEYWNSYVNDFLSGQAGNAAQQLIFKKAYEKSGCQSQEQCALLRVPADGAVGLKSVLPGAWLVIDRYYKDWFEQNKDNWEGDFDKTRLNRATVGAQTKDVSDLPGRGVLKNNPLYKSLSKKLCPDSATGGISLVCLAKLGLDAVDFFATE